MRPGRHAWTEDDDALLLRLHRRRKPRHVMATLLARSVHAVEHRLSRRQLVRADETGKDEKMNRRRMAMEQRPWIVS